MRKDNEKWEFTHNNFREYLTARFLSQKKLDYVLSIIALKDNDKVIRNSWYNTFAYLVLIYKNNDLINWVKQNDPVKLLKFELSRIDEKTRKEIFIAVFEDLVHKNMWLSALIDNVYEYAKFGE